MSAPSGFYVMHRGWMDNPAFGREPFTRAQAWIWLIEKAGYADRRYDVQGRTVTVKRGQFCASIRDLADAWDWQPAKVQRYLARLKTDTMIDTVADTGKTIITICNYDKYQPPSQVTDTATDTRRDTAAIQQRYSSDTQKKEGKERKEGNDLFGGAFDDDPMQVETRPKARRQSTAVMPEALPDDWAADANERRASRGMCRLTPKGLACLFEDFRNYWLSVPPSKRRSDWRLTWLNSVTDERTEARIRPDWRIGGATSVTPRNRLDRPVA